MPTTWWHQLLLQPCCPRCRSDQAQAWLCDHCRQQLQLPAGGCSGSKPLHWRALGQHQGALRQLLLGLRRRASTSLIEALAHELLLLLPQQPEPLALCAIPARIGHGAGLAQHLARAISRQSGMIQLETLQRRRACVGQHHLNRHQRRLNLRGAFHCPADQASAQQAPLLLIDDVITTGATGSAALQTLRRYGYRVVGLLALAHAPAVAPGGDGLQSGFARKGLPG